jgi:hypothetical protein
MERRKEYLELLVILPGGGVFRIGFGMRLWYASQAQSLKLAASRGLDRQRGAGVAGSRRRANWIILANIVKATTTANPANVGRASRAKAPFSLPAATARNPGKLTGEPVKMAIKPVAIHRTKTSATPAAAPSAAAPTTFKSFFIERSSSNRPTRSAPGSCSRRSAWNSSSFGTRGNTATIPRPRN